MNDNDQHELQAGISRRRFVQGSAVAGIGAFLAACTTGTTSSPPASAPGQTGSPDPSPSASATPESTEVVGPLNFANWDAYIDLTTDPGADGEEGTDDDEYVLPSPTLNEFQQQYGIEVNYSNAEIDDNETFMATIRPQFQAGVDTGWDLIVLTDWMAAKVVQAGWAEQINPAMIPDALANVRDELKGMPWDPNLEYHVPWQSGATGIGYNVVSTQRDLASIGDLFDEAFAGRVTLLSETRDTFPLVHLLLQARGETSENAPEEMDAEDAERVHAFLGPYVESGHIRGFTGNSYLRDFSGGDTWAAVVWSGDLASAGTDDDRFVFPTEGSMIWTDNALIPKGAQHKAAAEAMMNFVYDVRRAARIAAFIYYISPVKGVAEAISEFDEEAAENELLFQPPDVIAKQHPQPNWDEATEAQVNELYADLAGV